MSIPIGRRNVDVRYDPLDGAFRPEEILGANGVGNAEVHQALAIDGLPGRFGFSPNEMPQRRTDLADSGIVVYEVDANNELAGHSALGDPMIQVRPPIGGTPGIDEYAVDINNPINFLNTGRFFVNPSNVNKFYRIHRYFGLGTLNSVKNTFYLEQLALLEKLSRDGSLPMTGNLNFDSNKAVNLGNGTSSGDAVNKGQMDLADNLRVLKTGDTMSGNLTVPNGTAGGHAVNLNQLNAKLPPSGAQEIGTYVLAYRTGALVSFIGDIVSGSELVASSAGQQGAPGLNGNWRCMGYVEPGFVTNPRRITLWLRIS